MKISPAYVKYSELRRLTRILGVPLADVTAEIKKHGGDLVTPVTVKEAASRNEMFFLLEHQSEFPGMTIERHVHPALSPREPRGAHLRLRRRDLGGAAQGEQGVQARRQDRPGWDRGVVRQGAARTAGIVQRRVDSLGRPIGPEEAKQPPEPGYGLRLTLDLRLQRAAQQAVIDGINRAQADKKWWAKAGAVVAIDPKDGAIRALASYPTFDPSVYTRNKKSDLAPLLYPEPAEAANFPALNRAIAGAYPPGSTFKPVTALAAMQEHILTPYNSLPCTGATKSRARASRTGTRA